MGQWQHKRYAPYHTSTTWCAMLNILYSVDSKGTDFQPAQRVFFRNRLRQFLRSFELQVINAPLKTQVKQLLKASSPKVATREFFTHCNIRNVTVSYERSHFRPKFVISLIQMWWFRVDVLFPSFPRLDATHQHELDMRSIEEFERSKKSGTIFRPGNDFPETLAYLDCEISVIL